MKTRDCRCIDCIYYDRDEKECNHPENPEPEATAYPTDRCDACDTIEN